MNGRLLARALGRTGTRRPAPIIPALAVALVAAFAGPVAPASAAGSPDLIVSAVSVNAVSSTEWEIRYTVRNTGDATAGSSTSTVRLNGSTLLRQRWVPALGPGSSVSDTIRFPRNGACYVPVAVKADASNSVAESGFLDEYNNERWAVGLGAISCSTQPRYRVKATSLRADDESHYDWMGSDEPYWIFSSVGTDGTSRTTNSQTFDDVDTGESRYFTGSEGCLWSQTCGTAAPAPYGVGFSVQLWEHEYGRVPDVVRETGEYFKKAGTIASQTGAGSWVSTALSVMGYAMDDMMGWAGDDLLGSESFAFDPPYLARMLRYAGAYTTYTRRFCCTEQSAGARYTLSILLTRVS